MPEDPLAGAVDDQDGDNTVAPKQTDDVAQLRNELANFSKQVAGALQTLQQQIQQSQQSHQTDLPSDVNDKIQQLMTDPDSVISAQVREELKATLGPYLATQVEDNYNQHVERLRGSFDATYGPGSFDQHILPDLQDSLSKLPQETKSIYSNVRQIMDGIVGRKVDTLVDAKSKHTEQTQKAEQDRLRNQSVPDVMPLGLAPTPKGRLIPEEERYVEEHQKATGQRLDVDYLMKLRDSIDPNAGKPGLMSLSDWQAQQPKEKE